MKHWLLGLLWCLALAPSAWAARVEREYTTLTKTATATSNQTDVAIWTPASGKGIALQGCLFSAAEAGNIELEVADVDVLPPIAMPSGGLESASAGEALLYQGAVDAVLRWTTTINGPHAVMCWGYEW